MNPALHSAEMLLRRDRESGKTLPMAKSQQTVLEIAGREVVITNPDKVFFPRSRPHQARPGEVLRGGRGGRAARHRRAADRAQALCRMAPRASRSSRSGRPSSIPSGSRRWSCTFPSGRTAREIVVRDAAQLLWIVNLGCIDLNPHPVRADDLEHPDELRVDLDPGPGVSLDDVRRVALLVRDVLDEHGLRGWPKTSGSRGMHVNVRIERRWSFEQVRRAALALAREVERRAPDLATSKWWKEERHGVFLDYNQNAKDRTVASAWSVRPHARRARVDAARVGRGGRLRSGGVHAGHRAGAVRGTRRRVGRHRRARRDRSTHSSSCLQRKRLQASETRRGRRTIRSNVTSRRASRRHDGRPRAPALNAAAAVSRRSRSSPSPRRRTRRTRSPASNAGRRGIRKRRRGCKWTMSSSTRCAADRPPGLASGQPAQRSRGRAPAGRSARP